ncbi:MAG: GntR family transcriptional regulator [Verrucomicrobia bacterium]|jgi:DNA-binding LacI/PurR family transcriptional regulator|nr:GntR family transcriptional regulator [Verrucomicrobiota bacterium]
MMSTLRPAIEDSRVPLYIQIRKSILHELSSGLNLGDRIPTEHELSSRYGVNRGTVRKAVTAMVDDGLLVRVQGKGTFLSRSPTEEVVEPRVWDIALCVPTVAGDLMFNPFYAQVVEAVIASHEESAHITIHRLDESMATFTRIRERITGKGADGVLIVGNVSDAVVERFKTLSVPVVLGDMATNDDSVDAIVTDNMDASMQAVEYLIGLGHRRIATIAGPAGDRSCARRLKGYRTALSANGIPVDDGLIVRTTALNHERGNAAMNALLASGQDFTAVLAANDAVALGAIVSATARDVDIPGDISVIGFDDIQGASVSTPSLTTMRVDKEQMGMLIIERMLSRLWTYYLAPQRIMLSAKLVVRDSCRAIEPS